MSAFVELLGETLASKGGATVSTATALEGKTAVALYFSAHWCPPCRGFTPKFAEWYGKDLKGKGLEVVFVSSDNDESSFDEYFGEMPWLALPYSQSDIKAKLSRQFKVSGIPSVVILDGNGAVITKDGRSAIGSDPTGEDFPWKPKSLKELLSGAKYVGQGGAAVDASALEDKVLGFYFSAHWCPPCRGFTPKLAEWYTKSLKAKGFEVVFVSSDRDQAAFDSYFGEMPWLALDFSDRKLKDALSTKFGVEGIPTFVILDKDGSVITKDGRAAVSADPEGHEFPWVPKPVHNLAQGPGDLQEVPSVIGLCEAAEAAQKEGVETALTAVAKDYLAEQKAKGEDLPEYGFFIAKEGGGISAKLRSLMGFPALPPQPHKHPLAKADPGRGWGCDGCGQGGGSERYRCTEGCDFDFCGECNSKAGQKSEAPPKLCLLDLSEGGFYEGPEGDITEAAVRKLVADHKAGLLEKKPLGE